MKRVLGLIIAILAIFQTAQASKKIVVNLSEQKAYAYEDGRVVFDGFVSTGRVGHRTPIGHFRVLNKDLHHVSSKYPRPNGGARMDYALAITGYGVAMHLGYVPNYPASHGCIRMENGFAQKMFNWANVGTPVVIKGTPPLRVDRSASSYSSIASTTSRESSSKRFTGNDPLKLLSSIPGKSESVGQKVVEEKRPSVVKVARKKIYHRRRHHYRHHRHHHRSIYAHTKDDNLVPIALIKE